MEEGAHVTYSPEQLAVFQNYIEGKNIMMTGPGGTGKSSLIRYIYKHAEDNFINIAVCAMTGCAALLLDCNAKTIHSWAGIGLGVRPTEELIDKIRKHPNARTNWTTTQILIIDEVSMMSQKMFEMLDAIGKAVRRNPTKPFGGIQLIFSGDFYQLPPVYKPREDDPLCGNYCFESPFWDRTFYTTIQLKKIYRQQDVIYANILNELRVGKIRRASYDILMERVRVTMGEGVDADGNVTLTQSSASDCVKPTKIYPIRSKVDNINQTELKQLTTNTVTYEAKDELAIPISDRDQHFRGLYTPEQVRAQLQYIRNNMLCEEKLVLKQGAQVMCVVNTTTILGKICNGSRGVVTGFDTLGLPIVKFKSLSAPISMARHVYESQEIKGIGVSQIPLILAWALSIHKSQGTTLDCAEVDAGNRIFECGQTYVALSRVKDLSGLYLTAFDPTKVKINNKVREYYKKLDENEELNPPILPTIAPPPSIEVPNPPPEPQSIEVPNAQLMPPPVPTEPVPPYDDTPTAEAELVRHVSFGIPLATVVSVRRLDEV